MSIMTLMARARTNHLAPVVATKSLMHFDGANGSTTFTDQSGRIWTPHGGAVISTAQAKFGQSGAFGSSVGYLTSPYTTDYDFGTGDFCVESFVYFLGLPSAAAATWFGTYWNNNGWSLQFRNDGTGARIQFGLGDAPTVSEPWTPSINTWYHVACCRVAGNIYFYISGTLLGSPHSFVANIVNTASNVPTIGCLVASGSAIQQFYGYLDEYRLTKGHSPYTANFTPPTSPFSYP